MNINKGQEKTSILLFFLISSLKTFYSGKTKKCPTYFSISLFLEEFDHVELLSKGTFGHVYMAQKKMEKKPFAVKCLKLSANDDKKDTSQHKRSRSKRFYM